MHTAANDKMESKNPLVEKYFRNEEKKVREFWRNERLLKKAKAPPEIIALGLMTERLKRDNNDE